MSRVTSTGHDTRYVGRCLQVGDCGHEYSRVTKRTGDENIPVADESPPQTTSGFERKRREPLTA